MTARAREAVARGGRRAGGMTLLEVTISMALIAGVFLVVLQVVSDLTNGMEYEETVSGQTTSATSAIYDLMTKLRAVSTASPGFAVSSNGDSITFQELVNIDSATGQPQWGDKFTYRWQAMPGEVVNGVDDNGNKLIDEGEIVCERRDTLSAALLASKNLVGHVPAGGFSVNLNGRLLTVTVQRLADVSDSDKSSSVNLRRYTVTRSYYLRNPQQF